MNRFDDDKKPGYSDFSDVESQRHDLIPEEFPEGSYGSAMTSSSLGKSTPWQAGQHRVSAYGYENKRQHNDQNRSRHYPGDDEYTNGIPEVLDEP
ncbi:hypothetical protein [Paenibacillus protaetiae]|uniref:Cytosolic protein n=1 Tax=Paenibacillus protaetiae TaxID=2509456 RepID=A0A4P6EXY3_9BACL|nr:hypothetical protein [Paenibacillus protaetiae]QAY66619.1 hypothetical protein ET464_09590 [Paenibacillus protaetiae]